MQIEDNLITRLLKAADPTSWNLRHGARWRESLLVLILRDQLVERFWGFRPQVCQEAGNNSQRLRAELSSSRPTLLA